MLCALEGQENTPKSKRCTPISAEHVGETQCRTGVVAEVKLIAVALQVLLTDVMEGANQSAIKDSQIVLYGALALSKIAPIAIN